MKIWNTKYALTQGILEQDGEEVGSSMVMVGPLYYLHYEGRDWHRTREAAVARAEEMRAKKIASLKKQLKKLEGMKFQ